MTWTVEHEIPNTSASAARTSVYPYMWDTYLPSKGWNTGPHPGGNSQQRVMNWTYLNPKFYPDTGSITNYFWVSWTSSSSITLYEDSTYTSTPGDLATDTSSSRARSTSSGSGTWRFWVSSDNPNASMVTRGNRVFWFWPGLTDFYGYIDFQWDGSYDTGTTHLWPMTVGGIMIMTNSPASAGNSSTEYPLVPEYTTASSYGIAFDKPKLVNHFGLLNGQSSTDEYPGIYASPLSYMGSDDTRLYLPVKAGTNERIFGSAMFYANVNGQHWHLTNNGDLSEMGLAFLMSEQIEW